MSELSKLIEEAHEDLKAYFRGDKSRVTEHVVIVPDEVDVKAIRAKLGLSQSAFARRFGFTLSAVQGWERKKGRRRPDTTARILLRLIDREPRLVDSILDEDRVEVKAVS